MTKVIGVRFKANGKSYYFSPGDLELQQGDHVIVETARGTECGEVAKGPHDVPDSSIVKPLKTVTRMADARTKNAPFRCARSALPSTSWT